MKRYLLLLLCFLILIFSGCSETKEEKLPAIKVDFMHYNISGTHLLQINEAKDVMINRSEATTLYLEPPFPGIHIFAYRGLDRTPITYVPLDEEGDNITAYIGFEKPEDVPEKNDRVLVVIEVVEFKEGKFQTVDSRSVNIVWNIEYER